MRDPGKAKLFLLLLLGLALTHADSSEAALATSASKFARGRYGMVSASTPYATAAGVRVLEAGGNAVDAAAAACFALMVTDPAMTSIGGRTQILIALKDGRVVGIDGATQSPEGVPPLAGTDDRREGFKVVPVPGNPAALALAVSTYGKLSLASVIAPAIELAEKGFTVTANVGAIWESEREVLAGDPGTRESYLKPDGAAYREGELFAHPLLARLLRELSRSGPPAFYGGRTASAIALDAARRGGFLRLRDLQSYKAQPALVVRTDYRGYEVCSLGRHAWGNTLVEMLNILSQFEIENAAPSPRELEILARTISQSLQDRPQVLGSLASKPDGLSLDLISSAAFARQRADLIRKQLDEPVLEKKPERKDQIDGRGETTHVSVMDAQGNAVSLTTSIGPRFGSKVATPGLGFLYAHSYRMASDPRPHLRDHTEMTPTIVLRNGRPHLAVGAAGSERIPGAILQVISNVLDRGQSLESAINAARLFCVGSRVRLQEGTDDSALEHLRRRGFEVVLVPRTSSRHLGIVHAVSADSSGEFEGAADPIYDGTAAGPALPPREK